MKYNFVIIFIFFQVSINSQNLTIVNKIDYNADNITLDKLGFLYTLKSSEIRKYSSDGKLLYSFSNKKFGSITSIDATDPFKILVFYKDFGQILFLDNSLSVKGESLDLKQLDLDMSSLTCTSYQNGINLYEPYKNQIFRIDNNQQITFESGKINELTGSSINPYLLTESENSIYMADSSLGIFIFDKFGAYNKTIPIKTNTVFQIKDNKIYYLKKDILYCYNLINYKDGKYIALPQINIKIALLQQNLLFLLSPKEIFIYKDNNL